MSEKDVNFDLSAPQADVSSDGNMRPAPGPDEGSGVSVKPKRKRGTGNPTGRPPGRRRMKRQRHSKTPKPVKEPNPLLLPRREKVFIDQIPDATIRDLLHDLDKPIPEMSPLYRALTQVPHLEEKNQRLRDALVLATIALEGGNAKRAARRLRMNFQTVYKIYHRHGGNLEALKTPELIQKEIEAAKKMEDTIQEGQSALLETFWAIMEEGGKALLNRVREGKVADAVLNQIVKNAGDRALVLAGQPTSRSAKVAERALSDTQLEQLAQQNEEILRQLKPDSEPVLKVVE